MSKLRHNSRTKLRIKISRDRKRDITVFYLHCQFQGLTFSARYKTEPGDAVTHEQSLITKIFTIHFQANIDFSLCCSLVFSERREIVATDRKIAPKVQMPRWNDTTYDPPFHKHSTYRCMYTGFLYSNQQSSALVMQSEANQC